MGRLCVTSETVFQYPAEVLHDYASNPNNWGKNYKGSGGMQDEDEITKKLPLKFGDTWTEQVVLGDNIYHSTWTLITANRPSKWVFQLVNGIGRSASGSGGVDGICTIAYTFETVDEAQTLFRRTLTCEMPRGVDCPDDLLTAMAKPGGIDRYHDSIKQDLDKIHGNV